MRPRADGTPALAVERNDRFGRHLPSVPHIGQAGIHRGRSFLPARGVECELDQRDELMQWLGLGKLAGPKTAGEIEGAVLDREAPVQDIDIADQQRAELTVGPVHAEIRRRSGKRVLERYRAGNGKRAQPGETVGKVAEALAEENCGLERVRTAFPDAPSAGAADTPGQAGRDHYFVQIVLVEQSFQSETCRLEP